MPFAAAPKKPYTTTIFSTMSQITKYKQMLIDKNRSQVKEAKLTGLTKASICLIANGYGNPNLETLKRICVANKCTPNDIIEWEKWGKGLRPRVRKKKGAPEEADEAA